MNHTEEISRHIGETIRKARLDSGYKSRASLVGTQKLKKMITQEGLRKIEAGERIPRLENLRSICEVLGIGSRKTKELESLALEANVERVTKRAGNANVTFSIHGRPLHIQALPPKRKTEQFVRGTVDDLLGVVRKYGVLPADEEHFRRHARSILLKKLDT